MQGTGSTRQAKLLGPSSDSDIPARSAVQRALARLDKLGFGRPHVSTSTEAPQLAQNPLLSPSTASRPAERCALLHAQSSRPVRGALVGIDRAQNRAQAGTLKGAPRGPRGAVADQTPEFGLNGLRRPAATDARKPCPPRQPELCCPPVGAAGPVDGVSQRRPAVTLEVFARRPVVPPRQMSAQVRPGSLLSPDRRVPGCVLHVLDPDLLRPPHSAAVTRDRVAERLETCALKLAVGRPLGPASEKSTQLPVYPRVGSRVFRDGHCSEQKLRHRGVPGGSL